MTFAVNGAEIYPQINPNLAQMPCLMAAASEIIHHLLEASVLHSNIDEDVRLRHSLVALMWA